MITHDKLLRKNSQGLNPEPQTSGGGMAQNPVFCCPNKKKGRAVWEGRNMNIDSI